MNLNGTNLKINTVYGRVDSRPKTRRWFTTRLDETISAHICVEQISTSNAKKLDQMLKEGRLRNVPYGYGDTSFWDIGDLSEDRL